MGIKNFFNSMFGHSDNQMPSSLGHDTKEMHDTPNLGPNVQLSEDGDETSKKGEENQKAKEDKEVGIQDKQEAQSAPASETYNLIILDESGSMSSVRDETVSGCNETLNSIRIMAKKQPDIKQYVSIFCFDTTNSRYIFRNVPVEETRDLTTDDYTPCSCTPLYDAVGYTVTQLRSLIADSRSVAVVTIITDGYENASRRWNYWSVVELIAGLKKKGWVFTFIGANIDVEQTARGLGIDSFVEFEQTNQGMSDMFEKERRSRNAYMKKRSFMESMTGFMTMPDAKREEMLGNMNCNYFVDKERVAPDFIKDLDDNEIFVFGSNTLGHHSGGAALYAKEHFGAEEGKPQGRQGQSYAIPTDGNTLEELEEAVMRFTKYVVMHPQNKFMLTAVGCGAAGYSVKQIAPLFQKAYSFGNVYVPADFLPFMPKDFDY